MKSKHFFETCILSELIGKWYTRSNKIYSVSFDDSLESNRESELVYCYCKGPDEGDMIGCENPECAIEWFHMDCLKIKQAPNGKWYCPDYRKLPQFTRKGKRKQ